MIVFHNNILREHIALQFLEKNSMYKYFCNTDLLFPIQETQLGSEFEPI